MNRFLFGKERASASRESNRTLENMMSEKKGRTGSRSDDKKKTEKEKID